MADNPAPEPTPEPPADPREEAETAFWDKLDGHLDAWWAKKNPPEKKAPNPTGTSRTGGKRVTLSSLFADAVFGPARDD